MDTIWQLKHDLEKYQDYEKLEKLPKFFQAHKGGYGEGDQFIGVSNPHIRIVVKKHWASISDEELTKLLTDPIHEVRLTAIFILVTKFNKSKKADKQKYVDLYLNNLRGVNNWDLVDSSAYQILGKWLIDKDRSILYELADSKDLWKERISVIATKEFISKGEFEDTFKLAKKYINHKHDLMHKAAGWMLKEIGKIDQAALEKFLIKYYKKMPRTMLRYTIEKFEESKRQAYLKGDI